MMRASALCVRRGVIVVRGASIAGSGGVFQMCEAI